MITASHSIYRPLAEPFSYITHPLRLVLSFEFALAALTVVGGLKQNPTFAWMFPIDATAMLFIIVAFGLAWEIANHGIPRYALQPMACYFLFCLWAIASSSWTLATSLQPLSGFILRVPMVMGIMLAGTLIVVARSIERTVRFMTALSFFGMLMGINYIAQLGSFSSRIVPDDTQYNIVGLSVGNAFAIMFGYMIFSPILGRKWLFYNICLVILFYASMMVGSRQNVIGIILQSSLIILFAINVGKASIKIHVGFLPAMLIAILAILAVLMFLQIGVESRTISRLARLFSYVEGSGVDQSAVTRLHFLSDSLKFWTDSLASLFFGDGIFSFSYQERGGYFVGAHPHNIVMSVLADFGLIGLLIYLAFLGSLIIMVRNLRAIKMPIAPIIVALVAGSILKGLVAGSVESSHMILVSMALLAVFRNRPRNG